MMQRSGRKREWVVWAIVIGIVAIGAALFFEIADDGERGEAALGWIRTVQLAFFGLTLLILAINGVVRLRKRFGGRA